MADPLMFTLEVRGVSRVEAYSIAGWLVEAGAATPVSWAAGRALDGANRYDETTRVALFGGADQVVWTEADEEIADLSSLYPEAVFALDTHGYPEDTARTYFKGGRSYVVWPELSYPDFDANQLPIENPSESAKL